MKTNKTHLTSSTQVLHGIFENSKSGLCQQYTKWKVWQQWRAIVGQTIYDHTFPVDYKNGTLFIYVKNSTWHQQLTFLTEEIKNRINLYLEKKWVQRISFTLDDHWTPKSPKNPKDATPYLSTGFPNEDGGQ